jgi:basic amino acid/polyamine antiporter, APA family
MKDHSENKKQKGSHGEMKRTLGVASVFAICTGAAFSSGFFLLPGFASDETGPSLPLAFLVAGIFMLPAIFSISELSSAMPRSGGPYFFMTRSFGPMIGIMGAFGKYVQLVLKAAFAFVGAGVYLSLIMNVNITITAIILIVAFTAINLLGIKQAATTEKVLVFILILLLLYFLFAGVIQIISDQQPLQERFQPLFPSGVAGFITAIALVFVSYGGMGQVASVAEEIKEPSVSIPKGMMWALWVATFFYIAGTIVMIALVSSENLQDDKVPAATTAEQISRIPLPAVVMVLAALAAFGSTGNAAILSAARYPLALSRDQLIWKKFSNLDSKGIPKKAVLLTGILISILVLVLDVQGIAKMASVFLLFVFLGLCLAQIIFRESRTDEYQPKYRSPLYPWMQITGIIIYLVLIIASGLKAILFVAGVIIMSSLWFKFGIKKATTFSAAIYPLLLRIGKSGIHGEAHEDSLFNSVVKRIIFLELDEAVSFETAIRKASHAIKERVGGQKEEIEDLLQKEVKHWMHTLEINISVAPILLDGIEQPEMIVMKGEIDINKHSSNGLIIIMDDRSASARLLNLTTELEDSIKKEDFPDAWDKADSAHDIKSALLPGNDA